jgi:hypothetical protein
MSLLEHYAEDVDKVFVFITDVCLKEQKCRWDFNCCSDKLVEFTFSVTCLTGILI